MDNVKQEQYLADLEEMIGVDPITGLPLAIASGAALTAETAARVSGDSARPLKTSLAFNVKDDGALGDNANDDTAEIQATIDRCSAAGGGEVEIPRGTYRISSALSIPNFVKVRGHGESTIIRCTGNHYAFNFNPANRAGVSHLQIDAVSSQSSGGGFDYTNAQFNIRIEDIYLGNNLHTSFNIKPDESGGHFYISRVKWNGVSGCTNGLLIGDGTNLVAHVILRELLGVAATAAGMTNWMTVKNNVDTLKADVVEFYTGTNGILIGENAANSVTDAFFNRCLIDNLTGTGLNVSKCRGLNWNEGQIQTCTTGVNVGANSLGFKAKGGTIQNCTSDGVTVQSGASHWSFEGVTVCDNNTSNGAFGQGFDIVGGTSDWQIRGCTIGNNVLLAGFQKYGILISAGASDRFKIEGNTFTGNGTAPMDVASATGGKKSVRDNIGAATLTVASAATITLPGHEFVNVSGTTTITSVTAGYAGQRVTLRFTGVLTFTDGSNLVLAGNFVTTADDTITLVCDGTNWYEVARAVN